MLSLGCYSGNIFTAQKGIGERFCFFEKKGALAFGASRGLGAVSALNSFATQFYEFLGGEAYGEGLGDALTLTLEHFTSVDFGLFLNTLVEQFTLHGDPAIRLNPSPGPDYLVDFNSVRFQPEVINAQQDSFEVYFSLVNLGINQQDSITVKVSQQLPNGTIVVLGQSKINVPSFSSPVHMTFPVIGRAAVGLNTIFMEVDPGNEIIESPSPGAELNNDLVNSNGQKGISLFIFDNTADPVDPPAFGVASGEELLLKASTSDPFAPERTYLIEIDTTEHFNSSLKLRKEVRQIGGVISWKPDIPLENERVYYWRISPDSIESQAGFAWREASFVYLDSGTNGWNQSHYFQYQKDTYENLKLEDNRKFEFTDNIRDIRIRDKVFSSDDPPLYINNGEKWASPWPWSIHEGIQVTVMDSATTVHWKNYYPGDHGSVINGAWKKTYPFRTNNLDNRSKLIDFLENVIPDGNFVIVYSAQYTTASDYRPEQWAQDSVELGKNLFSLLESQGATRVRDLEQKGSVPYVFVYQKGRMAIDEGIADDINGVVDLEVSLAGNWFEGSIETPFIGPAKQWEQLNWQLKEVANMENDSVRLVIHGANLENGLDSVLFNGTPDAQFSLEEIDANTYPYLWLEFFGRDNVNRSAPQLDYWRVFYEGLPELALNPAFYYNFDRDSITQGDQLKVELAIENIGQSDMDSVLVKYSFLDNQNNGPEPTFRRYAGLPKGARLNISQDFPTRDLYGLQQMIIEANPVNDQPEQYHFNNFGRQTFEVLGDEISPVLDVTFDGEHIMDGDIIAPKPLIAISLQDENEFLALADTSLINIFLESPDGHTRRITFEDDNMQFFPAAAAGTGQPNRANIEFSPEFDQEGEHVLLIQAQDASGNQSGRFDYKVRFEVILKSMISNVLNYPNPFSTSTRFVYTLTGSEIPASFMIQIMTVSGRIVREITQDELGPMKVGTNMTEFVWDGTDEYGDRLANGVYLYRVVARKANGENFESMENTKIDRFFKNNLGKLVILR